ncbi:MAG: tRNA (N6-isopentenyl adenosine(37)-C2)-methylthiotransferase MiaB [Clostridiales bacterium]|nr:tRNA (N6-isopentenyl adenosine(37)-C2)-methylthiotransferase MiaB [Clostridiales bacterium]
MVKTYYITTYGCQMNVHESEKLAGILSKKGYIASENIETADIILFNTCAIRENAENHAFGNIGALKKLKKNNKDLIIAVGGCMTQQTGVAEILAKKFPFVDIIFGTHNLDDFGKMLDKKISSKKRVVEVLENEKQICEDTPKFRTSYPNAWVNITYGCNNFCTYCIVPYVRGRERSRKMDDILEECRRIVELGYKEITLLGQNVNSYGLDFNDENITFPILLKKIADIKGDFRLRFMTNHPKDLSDELIEAMLYSDKICKYIHLPVQSGSTKILELMNRRYTRENYLEKIKKLKEKIPNISITTDIMVGFPFETEEDFLDTLNLVKTCRFNGAFTFVYSKRKGTIAEKMDGQIEEAVSKDRIQRLIDLQNQIAKEISLEYKDKIVEVLCEDFDTKKEMYLGRDEFNRMCYFSSDENLIGKFVNVKITKTGGISLVGELV